MKPLAVLQEAQEGRLIGAVRFSPDQKLLAVAEYGGIRLWRESGWNVVKRIIVSPSINYAFEFIADGQTIIRGGRFDECVRVDLVDGDVERVQLPETDGYFTPLSCRPDQRVVMVGESDGVIVVWNPSNNAVEDIIKARVSFTCAGASGNGEFVAFGHHDGTVAIWSISERRQVAKCTTSKDRLSAIALSVDGAKWACGYRDGLVKVFARADGRECKSIMNGVPVSVLEFSPDGTLLAVGGSQHNSAPGEISMIDLQAGEIVAVAQRKTSGRIKSLDFSPDGAVLATASIRGEVCVWGIK